MECRKKEHVLYFTGEGPSANSSAPILQSQHFCLFGSLEAQHGCKHSIDKAECY